MKRVLIGAAEEEELICAKQAFNSLDKNLRDGLEVEFFLTGIGTTSTSYRLTKILNTASDPFDIALNIGIAGSFSPEFPIGSAARIKEEYFGDLGFETFGGFQTLFDYNILDADTFPYKNGALNAPELSPAIERALGSIRYAKAVTVQTVSGFPEKTERLKAGFSPEIESMEGAAFFYVCLLEKIPFTEIRTVSNEVGERDRAKWNIPLALNVLKDSVALFFKGVADE
jgi:futalosine hydrolase